MGGRALAEEKEYKSSIQSQMDRMRKEVTAILVFYELMPPQGTSGCPHLSWLPLSWDKNA
jgi:hypothetical protein